MVTPAREARQKLTGHTLWLWHYLHPDWQWEQSRAWHEDRYAVAVGEALDLMQRDPEFMYFFDTESEFFAPVARRLGPRLEELKQRVREGRIRIVSAQVANCRPNQVGDETYLRNLQLGRAFFAANLPPTDLSLFHSVDIAIGHSQMPQILRLAGFRYYRAWRPHGPMNALGIPHQFLWQGLDGSRILVTRGTYGGLAEASELADAEAAWDSVVARLYDRYFHDQLLDGRSPSGHLFLIQGTDDLRPWRTYHGDQWLDLGAFVAEWRRREAVPIRWCTPLEFSQAVAEQAERLPVVRGVLDGADCGYNAANGGANGLWHWRQMNDRRLLRAEWWAVAARSAGYPYPQEALRRLWRQHLTYQAHAQEFAFQDDFDHLVGLARDVEFQAGRIEREALGAIARAAGGATPGGLPGRLGNPGGSGPGGTTPAGLPGRLGNPGGGERTVQYIFNHHPWPVEAEVELYHPCVVAGAQSLTVVDEEGRPLPQQPLAEFRHPRLAGSLTDERRLVRLTLPAMGYRRVRVVESPSAGAEPGRGAMALCPEAGELEAGALRLVYRGHALREVHDMRAGVTYFSRDGSPWPNLVFHVLDRATWLGAGPELRREPFVPQGSEWLECGPLRFRHRAWGQVGSYAAQVETLAGPQAREIEIRVRLEGHWAEAPLTGFVTLLGDVEAGGQITVDVPFGVEPRDPDHDIYVHNVPQGRDLGIADMFERLRPGYFWGRSWADWSTPGHGLTWISADGCYYWFKEPGQLGHILVRCLHRTPGTWEPYSGHHLTGAGVHTFGYALHFHDGDWRAADPQRRSAELRHPPAVVRADGPAPATLPASHSFLALAGPALLSACYHEDGETFVRLYEREGQGGEAVVTFDREPASAQAVDLLGQAVAVPVQIRGRDVAVRLGPWQIVTLQVRTRE